MKKIFSLLAILMMAMTAWAQIYMPTGEGTSESPYKISRAEELLWFIDQVNQNRQGNTAVYGELSQDIDMTGFSDKFEPIGYWDTPYTGSFNGNGHRIKNLTYTGTAGKEVGFFGVVAGENATIKNLIIDSSCSFTTNTTQQAYGAAGIVACLRLVGDEIHFTLSGCGNEAAINGDLMVAGLVGGLLNAEESTADKCSITIENCYNTGNIKGRDGEKQTAALIAYGIQKLNVKKCYNTGTVTNCTEGHSLIRYNVNSTVGLDDDMRYNLSTVASDYNATSVTAEEFANGSICYQLNDSKSTGTLAWHQTIGTDASPVVESTHGTVYFTGTEYCPVNTYSNAETAHTPNTVDGISTCSVCQHISYQEPGQDASGNYLLGNKGNLLWFADKVNAGSTSINAKLTADIDLGDDQTKIGCNSRPYQGSFDGDGHTITVHYVATEDYTALFNNVKGATIKNLRTAGSITTDYKFAAGIVALCSSNQSIHTHITNCVSSVTITSTFSEAKDGSHGGIVADNQWEVYLTNVVFNGKLLGENATNCGGLVGCAKYDVYASNCLFCPSEVTFSSSEAKTLAGAGKVFLHVSNSYYTVTLGDAQGEQIATTAVTSGEACYKLNNSEVSGSQAWYQNLDNGQTVDATPVPFKTHGTVYGGENQCSEGYSNIQKAHTEAASYDDGEMYCADCHKFLHHQQPSLDADNTYLIANKGNLCWFANKVNSGQTSINGKLTADVSLGSNTDMIGTGYWYGGTFDGDGHTVTVNYTTTSDYTALFRYVGNATIKNLRTAGSINTTGEYAAGIVACCQGNTQITNCASSVAIKSTSKYEVYGWKEGTEDRKEWGRLGYFGLYGGIVARSPGSVTLNNVLFDGKITCDQTASWGGLIGFSGKSATITNCLFNPSYIPSNCDDPNTLARYESGSALTITNSYCAKSQSLGDGQGTEVSADQLRLGDVCNKLNAGNSSTAWTQNLETDAYPTLGNAGLHYARTMSNAWGTVVLPFDVAYDATNTNYKLYKLSDASISGSEGTLTFTEYADGTIAAGTPMVVKAIGEKDSDGKYTISIPSAKGSFKEAITTQTNANASLPEGWTMTGTYTDLTDKSGIYFIANNQFWYAASAISIASFRAWFTGPAYTSAQGAALRIVVGDGSETSTIGEITADGEVNFSDTPIYNIQGQRQQDGQMGLQIRGGRVVMIK